MQIELPYQWRARDYQSELMRYMDSGGTRAACVWHRRAGKDTVAAHQICKAAHERVGLYWHMLPTQRQARKVVWDGFTRGGVPFLDAVYPSEIRLRPPNATEMKVTLKSGSIVQMVGSDNYDALVGSNPIGVVFSEWSLTNPKAWEFIRPILRENGGWAIFIFTPRGYNHGWDMAEVAKSNHEWFYSFKDCYATGVITEADITEERRAGMPEELIDQEFKCSFSSANLGAILGRYIEAAEKEGRFVETDLYDPNGGEVVVSSDIGFRDTTAMWFWQQRPDGFALIDHLEESGMDAGDWIDRLHSAAHVPDVVYLPHDARAKTFQLKHSALEQFLKGGFKSVRVIPRVLISDRINAARTVMPNCRFQVPSTSEGLAALRAWSYEWDEDRKVFSKEPQHDWASHSGDAFSYGALVMARHVKDMTPTVRSPDEAARSMVEARGLHYAFNLSQLFEDRDNENRRRF
jgi:phage terminase large subunit